MIRTGRTIFAGGVTFWTGRVEIRVTDAADVVSREMPGPGADRAIAHDLDFHFEGLILLPYAGRRQIGWWVVGGV
jgi:hypothetical protein